jgi:hypothetical protein
MADGVAGAAPIVVVITLAALVPHPLVAVTLMVPPVVPLTTVIEVVVDVPLHPEGIFQLYDVAPDTAAML